MDVIRNCDKPQRSMRALASLHISRTFQMLQWSQYVIKASYSCFALYARGRIGSHSLGSPFWNYGTFMRWYARVIFGTIPNRKTVTPLDLGQQGGRAALPWWTPKPRCLLIGRLSYYVVSLSRTLASFTNCPLTGHSYFQWANTMSQSQMLTPMSRVGTVE